MRSSKNKYQAGDALLLSVFLLLLMSLGLFATMRIVKHDALTSGALMWHTKGKQAAEVVLETTMTNFTHINGAITATNGSWFRNGTGKPINWDTCAISPDKDNPALSCDKTAQPINGFHVYRVVQLLGGSGCNYYRISLHAVETSLVGSQVDTEAIYQKCE